MPTKEELIFKDVLAVFVLGIVVFYWDNELKNFWRFLFLFYLVKQILAHMKYYKLNNRFY
jgi:hypothetical protein